MRADQNSQVTNLGVAHKIDGVVIDITDNAMSRQVRLGIERKYEDTRIVNGAKWMMTAGMPVADIFEFISERVHASKLNDITPAR